jgi:hypothetical protein
MVFEPLSAIGDPLASLEDLKSSKVIECSHEIDDLEEGRRNFV